jgi:phage baseplate assembly protein W
MANMGVDRSFLGTGWKFPPEFDRHVKDVRMVSEDDDIRESLHLLLSTSPGERLMHPTYGCGLKQMVFENVDESIVTEIRDKVQRAILFFEPRIAVEGIDVAVEDPLSGVLLIQLRYSVRSTNSRSNLVYPFHFLEGTNIALQMRGQEPSPVG